MWTLKNKTNRQNKNILLDTENKQVVARRERWGENRQQGLRDINPQLNNK